MYKYLIVDDEPMIRYSVRYMLKHSEFPVAEILEAEDGNEAIERLKQQQIDFIFIDINMPKMNGLVLAEYIYEHARDSIMCIISGYDDFKYAQSAIRCGVRAYLLKPVNRKELYQTLADMIEEHKKRSSRWMSHDRFSEYAEMIYQRLRDGNSEALVQTAEGFLSEIAHVDLAMQLTIMQDLLAVLTSQVSAAAGEKLSVDTEAGGIRDSETELWFMQRLSSLMYVMSGMFKSTNARLAENARRYMEKNGWNISLDEISRELGINSSYFSRIFREESGMTFVAYRTELRMKRAGELLENPEKPVAVVALEVGYGDVTHFIRVFKKHKGESPSEYRKRLRL